MAEKKRKSTENRSEALQGSGARSLAVAARGVKTGNDFANLMSALMADLIEGRIAPSIGNATCNAGGKLLKVVEMQIKYGEGSAGSRRVLTLALDSPMVEQPQ